jgi:hypothetical protein
MGFDSVIRKRRHKTKYLSHDNAKSEMSIAVQSWVGEGNHTDQTGGDRA